MCKSNVDYTVEFYSQKLNIIWFVPNSSKSWGNCEDTDGEDEEAWDHLGIVSSREVLD